MYCKSPLYPNRPRSTSFYFQQRAYHFVRTIHSISGNQVGRYINNPESGLDDVIKTAHLSHSIPKLVQQDVKQKISGDQKKSLKAQLAEMK